MPPQAGGRLAARRGLERRACYDEPIVGARNDANYSSFVRVRDARERLAGAALR